MQRTDLVSYIKKPQLLKEQDVIGLQQLTQSFPYFQSAHVLLSMASKRFDATAFQHSLKKTAILATNRSVLFHLMQQMEKPMLEVLSVEKIEPAIAVKEKEKPSADQTIQQELDILKAAEIVVEVVIQKEKEKEAELLIPKVIPVDPNSDFLEKEIGKNVVNSFVEKEILKTNEVFSNKNYTEPAVPESFNAWLSYLNAKATQAKHPENNSDKISQKPAVKRVAPIESKKEEVEPVVEKEPVPVPTEKNKLKQKAIIDKIIESSPGLIRIKEDQKFFTPDQKAKESLLENEHLVTETLAKIYALQGNVNKAIRSYEILSLKYPQKNAYFASLIKKLKSNP